MTEKEQKEIFERWLKQYRALLFKVVRVYAFSPIDQDDLFQEILIQVWRSVTSFKEESSVSTWLYRISLNTAFKWTRKERKHYEGKKDIESAAHVLEENKKPMDERLAWLYEEIARLDTIDRSLTLLLLDGFSYKEMSKILGITEANISVKVHRIKKHLITKSEKYDHYGV